MNLATAEITASARYEKEILAELSPCYRKDLFFSLESKVL